jgi:alpha-amylase/alpha-mannosidase (GH57 family)
MAPDIKLALIWHMHQPDYRYAHTGNHILPWVRIHSLRGYLDVASISEKYPGFKQTINFSPVLLSQIVDLCESIEKDYFYELSRKPADELTDYEEDFILRHFFFINWEVHVKQHQRYNQLLLKRGMEIPWDDLSHVRANFKLQDFRDLVVLFNLLWCGFTLMEDPLIAGLLNKGRGYTEDEKCELLDKHVENLRSILPRYKKLYEDDRIEITCTPEYHPILPLLIDSRVREDGHPDTPDFKYPADARRQIIRGREIFKKTFGRYPDGMWPSEGSVSQEAVELMQSEGIKWMATDEALLLDSRTGTSVPEEPSMYHPWLVGNSASAPLYCFFRNRGLSDDIGFKFSGVKPEEAVENFIENLKIIGDEHKGDEPPLVTIVCDGENPWEYFPDSGKGFLTGLAEKLKYSKNIQATTPSEFLKNYKGDRRIKKIGAGSWINADFGIWMGAEEDRRAWRILLEARKKLDEVLPLPGDAVDEIGTDDRMKILEHLWVAEGSDWFWWFGEPFTTPMDYIFDFLFRGRVRRAYELMNVEPPVDVLIPVDPSLPFDNINVEQPLDIIIPEIDGKITNFFEWSGSGHLKASFLEGLVASKKTGPISDIYFSADTVHLFIRLDIDREDISDEDILMVRFIRPSEINLTLCLKEQDSVEMRLYKHGKEEHATRIESFTSAAIGDIVEMAIPVKSLDAKELDTICFRTFIMRGKEQIDRCPLFGTVSVTVPDEKYISSLWRV